MTRAVLTPRAVWWRARAPVGLSKLCQLLALSAWHGIAQERSAGSSIKQISAPCAWRESPEPDPGRLPARFIATKNPDGGRPAFWETGFFAVVFCGGKRAGGGEAAGDDGARALRAGAAWEHIV